MTLPRALFSSKRTTWETPPDLFAVLHREFRFTLDVCATRSTRKCHAYFAPSHNALRQRWTGTCWMNPPYGRQIGLWTEKALRESVRGSRVVGLLPVRTDTTWWQDHVMRAREIRLLRGRLTFVGATTPAPFPSAIVIFEHRAQGAGLPRVIPWDWRGRLGSWPAGRRRAALASVRAA